MPSIAVDTTSSRDDAYTAEMMARALYGREADEPEPRGSEDQLDPARLSAAFNQLRTRVAELTAELEIAERRLDDTTAEAERATRVAKEFSVKLQATDADMLVLRSQLAAATKRAEEAESGSAGLTDMIEAARAALQMSARGRDEPEIAPAEGADEPAASPARTRPVVAVAASTGTPWKRSLLGWMQ